MVTTTEWMVYGVHANTTDARPAVTLRLVFEVGSTSLQDGLVDTATASNNTNHSSVDRRDGLLGARGQLDLGLLGVGVVRDDGGVVARRLGESAAVAALLLELAHDRTLGHLAHGQHVAHGDGRFLSAVDVLAGVDALGGHHELLARAVLVAVAEGDDGERRASARVVDDLAHDALDVALSLGEVDGSQAGSALAMERMRLEHSTAALALRTDYSTHLCFDATIDRSGYFVY